MGALRLPRALLVASLAGLCLIALSLKAQTAPLGQVIPTGFPSVPTATPTVAFPQPPLTPVPLPTRTPSPPPTLAPSPAPTGTPAVSPVPPMLVPRAYLPLLLWRQVGENAGTVIASEAKQSPAHQATASLPSQ